MAKLQNLERLSLNATKVTDEGLKEVAKLQMLQQLYLPSQITDAGLKEVAKLCHHQPWLERHKNHRCRPQGGSQVAEARFLDLSYTRITGAGVAN